MRFLETKSKLCFILTYVQNFHKVFNKPNIIIEMKSVLYLKMEISNINPQIKYSKPNF